MKFSIFIILFSIGSEVATAQCSYKDYEKYISKNCADCNLSQINDFVYDRCRKSDSLLIHSKERFHNKLVKQFNGSSTEKDKIDNTYNKSFDALIKARDEVFKNYDSLTSTGDNRYYTQLFYWYYTDKANEILIDIESTLFGE